MDLLTSKELFGAFILAVFGLGLYFMYMKGSHYGARVGARIGFNKGLEEGFNKGLEKGTYVSIELLQKHGILDYTMEEIDEILKEKL